MPMLWQAISVDNGKNNSMVSLFFEWYFLEVPKKIKKIWENYLWFFGRYFAIPDLAREFLAPWKGLVFHREKKGLDFGDIFSAMFGNLISRIIGAMMRLFFLILGLAAELIALAGGVLAYAVWLILIPEIFYCFWRGVILIFQSL